MTEYEFDTPSALEAGLADALAYCLQQALAGGRQAALALSPDAPLTRVCAALADRPLDWSRVSLCLTDACWAAPGSAADREHQLRRALAGGAAVGARVHGLRCASISALHAVPELVTRVRGWPNPFDVLVMTVRDDGGIAGLHPDMPALAALLDPRWSVPLGVSRAVGAGSDVEGQGVTLSLRSLLQTRQLFVVVPTAGATAAVEAALAMPVRAATPIAALLRHAPVAPCLLRVSPRASEPTQSPAPPSSWSGNAPGAP